MKIRCALLFACLLATSQPLTSSGDPLPKVTNIRAIYVPNTKLLQLNWDNVKGARNYRLRIFQGQTLLQQWTQRTAKASVPAGLLQEGLTYNFKLQALGGSSNAVGAISSKKIVFNLRASTAEFYGASTIVNSGGRKGMYFLPKDYRLRSTPLLLLLHGSSISGKAVADIFKSLAREHRFIIVAPDSTDPAGWSYEDSLGPLTSDQRHIQNCLYEVLTLPHLSVDSSRSLIAGISAGGEVAAFLGSHDSRFSHAAVLHGGVNLLALGNNKVPIWLSTGTKDELRPPKELQAYLPTLLALGFSESIYREFPVAHSVPEKERAELVKWWLK